MDSELLERLLHEDEGTALDFKQAQYAFEKARDRQKSELLKDILAFANAWRRTDAYILIGVQEVQGGRSKILGVTEHLPEASLQQFVNKKTNRPVSFSYEAILVEGKQIGVIRIPTQERPFYLLKDFGKLKQHEVYIRRGSSTDIATPDEIALMGANSDPHLRSPLLSLKFANVTARKSLGQSIAVQSLVYTVPDPERFPDYEPNRGIQNLSFTTLDNTDFFRDYAWYFFLTSALVPIGFVVRNLSATLVRNARIEIKQPKDAQISFLDEADYPERPAKDHNLLTQSIMTPPIGLSEMLNPPPGRVAIIERSDHWDVSVSLGDIQPKAFVWSDEFYVLCGSPGNPAVEIRALIYMDESEPLHIPLVISFLYDYEPIDGLEKLQELITEDERWQEKEIEELLGK